MPTLQRPSHEESLKKRVGVYMDLRIDMEQLQHLQIEFVIPFIQDMQMCILGHLQLSLHLVIKWQKWA